MSTPYALGGFLAPKLRHHSKNRGSKYCLQPYESTWSGKIAVSWFKVPLAFVCLAYHSHYWNSSESDLEVVSHLFFALLWRQGGLLGGNFINNPVLWRLHSEVRAVKFQFSSSEQEFWLIEHCSVSSTMRGPSCCLGLPISMTTQIIKNWWASACNYWKTICNWVVAENYH